MNSNKLYRHCFSSTGLYLGCKEVNPLIDKIKATLVISTSILLTMTVFLFLCKSRGIGQNNSYSNNHSVASELQAFK